MSRYLSICDKYTTWAAGTAALAPMAVFPALTSAFLAVAVPGLPLTSAAAISMSIGFFSGAAGVTSAMVAHAVSEERCRREQVGLTKGGKRVRRAQTIAYAIPLAAGLALNFAVNSPSNASDLVEKNKPLQQKTERVETGAISKLPLPRV